MVELPGFAIPPISISRIRPDGLDLTIRSVGPATAALTNLAGGAQVSLRGPLGRGWPIEAAVGRDVVIVAGGIGLAPLRPLIEAIVADRPRFGAVRLYLGARTPRDRLFVAEMNALAGRTDLEVEEIVDRAGPTWLGRVGIVTQLFDHAPWDGSLATAFMCGPERMMQAAATTLNRLGVARRDLWLTLERNMACGVGTCGHCQLGPFFVCRDGPVFSQAELGTRVRSGGTVMTAPLPVEHEHQSPRAAAATAAAHRRRQVRLVRRLPADPARPRGRAAGDRREGRHRRVRRGHLAALGRPVRRPVRRGLDQRPRAGRRDHQAPGGHQDAGDDRRVRHGRRHPGDPQLVRPRGDPARGLPGAALRRVAGDIAARSPTTWRSMPSFAAAPSHRPSCASSSSRWSPAGARSCPTRPSASSASDAAWCAWPSPAASPASARSRRPAAARSARPTAAAATAASGLVNRPTRPRWRPGSSDGRNASDVSRLFTGFTAWSEPFRKVIDAHGGPPRSVAAPSETTDA